MARQQFDACHVLSFYQKPWSDLITWIQFFNLVHRTVILLDIDDAVISPIFEIFKKEKWSPHSIFCVVC